MIFPHWPLSRVSYPGVSVWIWFNTHQGGASAFSQGKQRGENFSRARPKMALFVPHWNVSQNLRVYRFVMNPTTGPRDPFVVMGYKIRFYRSLFRSLPSYTRSGSGSTSNFSRSWQAAIKRGYRNRPVPFLFSCLFQVPKKDESLCTVKDLSSLKSSL